MNKLYVGKVVGTHGIKGEIKVYSELEIKDKVFKENTKLYFNDSDKEYTIEQVRFHKENYLVLLLLDYFLYLFHLLSIIRYNHIFFAKVLNLF